MGPLYHLVERSDRLLALREARRVVRPGGCVVAVGISRFASLLDGLRSGWLGDPVFSAIAEQDLKTGQHRNPEPTAGQNGLPRPICIARTNWPRKLQQRAYWSRECLESKDRAG